MPFHALASTTAKDQNECISFDSKERLIEISCKEQTHLTDIYNKLQNPDILKKTQDAGNESWILNAGIVVDAGSTLVIDSKDTKWLKILLMERMRIQSLCWGV